ncbi:uncharacterized protein LOC118205577 [Stegodyphus dumicola]|uniref:uncharacterized protein LOC118205577 n=1 Tax=Stegodyphus dumicola TaxID=202533 RepID=UPI0015A80740|nr:uncharacterized protein LOC118205577 [Stegodyphus dumicola]
MQGAKVSRFGRAIKVPQRLDLFDQDPTLRLQNSVFSYVVSGTLPAKGESKLHCGLITDNLELERAVRDFWEIENVERESEISKSKEAEICEQHFLKNYSRTETGKYLIKILFKENPMCLGNSKQISLKTLNSLWTRLIKDENYLLLYYDFLHEYSELGHMTEVKDEDEQKGKYYIPHLGIYRPEKSSTPLRVVFNASTATSKGNSLNSIQCNGGVIQEDLFSIMVRFRKHISAFTADINKMYRMISIHPTQRQLQIILWKESINGPIKTFDLTRSPMAQ